MRKLTTEEFIKRIKKIWGDKYDYSKIKYVDAKTKICIICHKKDINGKEHGEFYVLPGNIRKDRNCPKCSKDSIRQQQGFNNEEFIRKAKEVHGDKYDYSKVKYYNTHTKVCIICPIHGEFEQTPANHLRGQGCDKCAKIARWDTRGRLTTEVFIQRAKEIHGDKYNYSKVECINAHSKVIIICPIHGEFEQEAFAHLTGQGCPRCIGRGMKQYKFNLLEEFESEYAFRVFLENNDVNILYVILRNIEPKYEPLKRDIEKALAHSNEVDPIKALRDKYTSDSEDELDEDEEEVENETEDFEITTAPSIDLDDDDAIDEMVETDETKEVDTPTIEDIIKNTQREIKVINKIEHMLTPEDREYIMQKFLNDKRRIWMAARENRNKT